MTVEFFVDDNLIIKKYLFVFYRRCIFEIKLFRIESKWTLLTLGNQLITEKIDSIEPPQVIGIEHDKPVNLIFNQEFPAHNRQ